MSLMSSYVPLWCKSNFSFLEGASHPEELIEEAHRLGLPALTLTDRDGVYGIVRAHVKARELGLHLIIGSQVTVDDGSTIVLLAQDRDGYANLCRLLTVGRLRSEKGASVVSWDEVCRHSRDSSRCGEATAACWWARAIPATSPAICTMRSAIGSTRWSPAIGGNMKRCKRRDCVSVRSVMAFPRRSHRGALSHAGPSADLQDVLTCIRHGVPLTSCGTSSSPTPSTGSSRRRRSRGCSATIRPLWRAR